jgi:hypothetical protein
MLGCKQLLKKTSTALNREAIQTPDQKSLGHAEISSSEPRARGFSGANPRKPPRPKLLKTRSVEASPGLLFRSHETNAESGNLPATSFDDVKFL